MRSDNAHQKVALAWPAGRYNSIEVLDKAQEAVKQRQEDNRKIEFADVIHVRRTDVVGHRGREEEAQHAKVLDKVSKVDCYVPW